jgi:hypothetical protein
VVVQGLVGLVVHAHGHGAHVVERRLGRRADGAGVVHGHPGVISVIDAGYHQVGRLAEQAEQGQAHAVGGRARNRPGVAALLAHAEALHVDGVGQSNPLAGGALLHAGRAYAHLVPPRRRRPAQRVDARALDTVVVHQ